MRWGAEAIWQAIEPGLPGFSVEVLPEVGSTNDELMRRAHAGRAEPVLLVAEHQSAGRGRSGRTWHSAPGDSLTVSFGLPLAPQAGWSGLSLAVGLALAEALHPAVRIKWPNDLWLAAPDRKLGGILIETATLPGAAAGERYVVVGVGLNIAEPDAVRQAAATAAGGVPPAGLRALLPEADAPGTLGRIAPRLATAVLAFAAQGFAPLAARYAARDALAGRSVLLRPATGAGGVLDTGTAAGVAPDGALRVDTARGPLAVTSAEVSVRPTDPN